MTALASLLTGRRVKPYLSMTGETTLSGLVLPVGGIKEKVLAAKRAGVKEVILPRENEVNVKDDLKSEQLGDLKIHYVRSVEEVLDLALLEARPRARERKAASAPKAEPEGVLAGPPAAS